MKSPHILCKPHANFSDLYKRIDTRASNLRGRRHKWAFIMCGGGRNCLQTRGHRYRWPPPPPPAVIMKSDCSYGNGNNIKAVSHIDHLCAIPRLTTFHVVIQNFHNFHMHVHMWTNIHTDQLKARQELSLFMLRTRVWSRSTDTQTVIMFTCLVENPLKLMGVSICDACFEVD